MVNTRNVVGRYDMAVVLKAQVDNLTGRNAELRCELHEVRCEAVRAQENFNKANFKARLCELPLIDISLHVSFYIDFLLFLVFVLIISLCHSLCC